ncbi:putative transposase, partial [Mycobacterium xenopi 4042]
KDVWSQIWSNNPAERLTKRSAAAPTPSGSSQPRRHRPSRRAVLANRTTNAEGRRYLGLDILPAAPDTITDDNPDIGANDMPALTA